MLEQVVGFRVDQLELSRGDGYVFNPIRLTWRLRHAYNLVILVNPNSPTGRHVLQEALGGASRTTRF